MDGQYYCIEAGRKRGGGLAGIIVKLVEEWTAMFSRHDIRIPVWWWWAQVCREKRGSVVLDGCVQTEGGEGGVTGGRD